MKYGSELKFGHKIVINVNFNPEFLKVKSKVGKILDLAALPFRTHAALNLKNFITSLCKGL